MARDQRGTLMAIALWKGNIEFGALCVPVKLYTAARRQELEMHLLHKSDNSRLRQVFYCCAEDAPVFAADIVKGMEIAKGEFVTFTADELSAAAPKPAENVRILEFVKAIDISPIWFESSFYLAPAVGAGERPYALLYEAMRKTECCALVRIVIRGREHLMLLTAGEYGIVVHSMFYADETRALEEFRTDRGSITEDELALAVKLVQAQLSPFQPAKYTDNFRAKLLELVRTKAGRNASSEPHATPASAVLQALKRSVKGNARQPRQAARSASTREEKRSHISKKPHHKPRTALRSAERAIPRTEIRSNAPESVLAKRQGILSKAKAGGGPPPKAPRIIGTGSHAVLISSSKQPVTPVRSAERVGPDSDRVTGCYS